MFPTLAILNAPKSGTPNFGVKPAMTAETETPLFCIHSTEICYLASKAARETISRPPHQDVPQK
jgi:hypothetical protein